MPVRSFYWWKDKIEHAQEWICLAKAKSQDYDRIQTAIERVHSYEVPEILDIPVLQGSINYLDWIRKETASKQ